MEKFVFEPRTVYKHNIYHQFPDSKNVFHLKKLKNYLTKVNPPSGRFTNHVSSMATARDNDRFHDFRLNIDGIPMVSNSDCHC